MPSTGYLRELDTPHTVLGAHTHVHQSTAQFTTGCVTFCKSENSFLSPLCCVCVCVCITQGLSDGPPHSHPRDSVCSQPGPKWQVLWSSGPPQTMVTLQQLASYLLVAPQKELSMTMVPQTVLAQGSGTPINVRKEISMAFIIHILNFSCSYLWHILPSLFCVFYIPSFYNYYNAITSQHFVERSLLYRDWLGRLGVGWGKATRQC